MNCETFRERLGEDPSLSDEDLDRHAEACTACGAYRARLSRAEALIREALRFDVRALGDTASRARAARAPTSGWVRWASGIAAVLIIGLMYWTFVGSKVKLSPEALAEEVAQHWYHEPESWTATDVSIADSSLVRALDGQVVLDRAAIRTVSYARSCFVAGRWLPHLVVQGDQGPYMVLLMPNRALESPVPLELRDEGLRGRIVPAGNGSIAVLGGGEDDELTEIERSFIAAVDWTI